MISPTTIGRLLCLVLCILLPRALLAAEPAAINRPAGANPPDVWAPWRFFIGRWEGESKGQPGVGKSERTYAFALNGRYLHVSNKSVYPAQSDKKGSTHEDVGFISYDRAAKKFVFRQFHIEGFVNHYVLERISEDGSVITFVSLAIENIAPGWRAREVYTIVNDDEFTEVFSLAEPGKEFAVYSEGRFKRRK